MVNQLVWNEQYNIGVDAIDKEHRRLFRILNKLVDFGQQETKSQWVCQEAVKYFKDHTLQHFLDEEAYMEEVGYLGRKIHTRIHRNFRDTTLPALEKELEASEYSGDAVSHFIGVCAGWLIGHTLIEDRAIVSGKTVEKWEKLLPEEEQAVMGQVIVSQLHSMFQLNAQLVSNCYGGEKFGNGIYYRLIYATKDNKKCEFLLVFEEQLIVSTMGSVLETKSGALSVMMMNAARYTARQLVEYLKEHFSELDEAEVKEEQLLTYEQFQKVFEKHSPQFSLLFDTGKGYFAYCMTAVGMMPVVESGITIITENAMTEVGKYLSQNRSEKALESSRKKILVVDDSNFVLKMMKKLLGDEYEVITVSSGLAAFRTITLNKPDLVLLDYEMPVCKGNQVLEMMRAEKEFADIPVFFLTAKVDRESIQKVLELKPQRYLTKSLPPEKIKREIDVFFESKNNETAES